MPYLEGMPGSTSQGVSPGSVSLACSRLLDRETLRENRVGAGKVQEVEPVVSIVFNTSFPVFLASSIPQRLTNMAGG